MQRVMKLTVITLLSLTLLPWSSGTAFSCLQSPLSPIGWEITHTVREGDTIASLAKLYGTCESAIRDWNYTPDEKKLEVGSTLYIKHRGVMHYGYDDAHFEYKVIPGDTIEALAKRFNVKPDEIRALNHLGDPDNIRTGATLLIPTKCDRFGSFCTYTVRKGDTFAALKRDYFVDMKRFKKLNGLSSPDDLKVGAKLMLPLREGYIAICHSVGSEDTLWSLAKKCETTVEQLQSWNGLSTDTIRPQQQLTLIFTSK